MLDIFAPTATDFYKTSHAQMIPESTSLIYTNFTARTARLFQGLPDYDGKAVVLGVQRAVDDIVEMWRRTFFSIEKNVALKLLSRRLERSLPDNCDVDGLIVDFADLHDLGYLPLRIKALPEGRRVGMKVPFMTVVNTDARFAFLTNYLETIFSDELWKTIVNATTAFEYRRLLDSAAMRTAGSTAAVSYQAHDFSMRGMSGVHDAANTGIAHLACFLGTDTIPAIDVVEKHYPEHDDNYQYGCSVPATEHLVMCLGGRETEIDTFRDLIVKKFPTGIVSIVSDTWDFFRVVTEFVTRLKTEILARRPDSSGQAKVVFRPDSGDPVKIICGDPEAPMGSPERKGAVECLYEVFGGERLETGYILLHPAIGVIYGDSITLARASAIVAGLEAKGFASTNVVFGVGSFTYQYVTRDSLSITSKGTYAVVDGSPINLFKNPATDDGTKKSATGLLRVDEVNGEYVLREGVTREDEEGGALQTIFEDNAFLRRQTWSAVRANIAAELASYYGVSSVNR
ncbi:nicotinate phosphoribosyltransferase [Acetobacter sacchari]|nr:nicotinate phosphoribosyltransferase [Acetobacter sacchari]